MSPYDWLIISYLLFRSVLMIDRCSTARRLRGARSVCL